jgi:HK97 family phage prohead protease
MILTKNSAVALDSKAVTESGQIEGYASVFGNVDSYGEIVEPGAFVDSLVKSRRAGRTIKMLWQHDPHQPIGVWDDLAEDGKGLWVKGRLFKDSVAKAAEAYALLREGGLDGLSIGYRTIKAQPKEGKPGVVSLLELDLLENSIVTFAANERARVEVVKAMLDAGRLPTVREFEGLLRDAGFSKAKAAAIAAGATPHLRGEPEVEADPLAAYWAALRDAEGVDLSE